MFLSVRSAFISIIWIFFFIHFVPCLGGLYFNLNHKNSLHCCCCWHYRNSSFSYFLSIISQDSYLYIHYVCMYVCMYETCFKGIFFILFFILVCLSIYGWLCVPYVCVLHWHFYCCSIGDLTFTTLTVCVILYIW